MPPTSTSASWPSPSNSVVIRLLAYAYEMSDGPWVLRLPRVGEKELQAMIHRWQLRFPHAELSVRSRGLPPPR